MEQPKLNVDITKTTPILNKEGGQIWAPGFILRKANKFLTGTAEDMIMPIQVFYNPITGEICKDGLPEALKFIFEDGEE